MWADGDIERNITSSDVEFLEGEDSKEKDDAKTSRKVGKDKLPVESARASSDNARHVLTTPDLSGLLHDEDVDMNVSVHDQMIDKELTLSHVARPSPLIVTHSSISIPQQSSERTLAILSQSMLKHNKYPVLMFFFFIQCEKGPTWTVP